MAANPNPFAATGMWLRCALCTYGRKAWTNPLWT
jgi:hypothetical protein